MLYSERIFLRSTSLSSQLSAQGYKYHKWESLFSWHKQEHRSLWNINICIRKFSSKRLLELIIIDSSCHKILEKISKIFAVCRELRTHRPNYIIKSSKPFRQICGKKLRRLKTSFEPKKNFSLVICRGDNIFQSLYYAHIMVTRYLNSII